MSGRNSKSGLDARQGLPLRAVKPISRPQWNAALARTPVLPKATLYARYPPNCDVHGRDPQCLVNVDSGRLTSKIFYAETFATTKRAISGLSRQTPSARMTKSAGSNTGPS